MEKKAFFQQLDERTDIRYTDSGLKIFRLKFPRAHLRLCNVKIDFGSRDVCIRAESGDTLLPYGTAHFLEHLLFWHNGRNLYSDFCAWRAFKRIHYLHRYQFHVYLITGSAQTNDPHPA